MRIGVDSRPLRESQMSGIPAYVGNILKSLSRLDPDNEYVLFSHKDIVFDLPSEKWTKRAAGKVRYGTIWMQTELPFWLKQEKIDVFWGTQHILPLCTPVKTVLTVHDLVYCVYPKTMQFINLIINRFFIPSSIAKADAIVTDSHWTLRDIEKYMRPMNKLTEVTYLGVGSQFAPHRKKETQEKVNKNYGLSSPYLLSVGAFEPRKNILRLVEAFARIADKIPHQLAIVGPKGWKNEAMRKSIFDSPLRDRIVLLGYVKNEDLPLVYAGADIFVFPSIYEGFGIPPLEAMASGVPVVASKASSIPEVVGDAAILIDPLSVDQISAAILKIIENPDLRTQMVARSLAQAEKFNWDETAMKILRVFEHVSKKG